MKRLRLLSGVLALGFLVTSVTPVDAAWDNVFQVTCGRRARTAQRFPLFQSFSAPVACCNPCPPPPPVCQTSYVQRCYYQPVTTYETKTYYEPVTTYRTSYYYEPVTTVRYSSYFDPACCSYKQVATPVTSYQLKAQSCPVQTWVQRCCSVPVTSYQRSCYWQAQTSCCGNGGAPMMSMPMPGAPPNITEQRQTAPPPLINEQPNPQFDKYYGPSTPGASYRQLPPAGQPLPQTPPPSVKLDRIAFGPETPVTGQLVSEQNAPLANAKLLFVSAQRQAPQQNVTADTTGNFQATLAPGGWLIYVDAPDGRQVFHSRIEVTDQQASPFRLVSR
jgi:hypothetical protein